MEKLVVVIMGQDCEKFIVMCLDSVKEADAIVYCDGGSTDRTLTIVSEMHLNPEFHKDKLIKIIQNEYDQEDKQMNGKQRNFYLDYVKKNYPDWWCLCLDADEVVEDLSKIKIMIQEETPCIFNIKMRHLIGDLAHEDAITPEHWVLNRLFHISLADKYPEVEHPILNSQVSNYNEDCTTIWHLSYIPNMWEIKRKYENHLAKSNIHTPEYLKNWYYQHIFGAYPKKQFNPLELPKVITDEFNIDRDELYFANRGLEVKHSIMVKQWYDYFKPTSVCALGCGKGPFVYYWRYFLDKEAVRGYEISQYAVDNAFSDSITQGNITEYIGCNWDLVTCIDVLEHLTYEELDKTINLLSDEENARRILVSVPFKDTPNCENDPTHIIKETKEWWIKKFTEKGLKQIETPEHFLFKEQLLIFEKEVK